MYGGQADASAPQGNAGRLLLDLNNIVIQAEAPGVSYDVLTLGSPFSGSGNGFAKDVLVLQGGNIVATDPYSDAFGTDSGAVYLFDGNTGALISALTGSKDADEVGSGGITQLSNGNYLVVSDEWGSGGNYYLKKGAVTWGSGTSGVSGAVSSANSLVGGSAGDFVGSNGALAGNNGGITELSNGNYLVRSPYWGSGGGYSSTYSGKGAVTWGSGTSGVIGVVSSDNSLVGSNSGDSVGSGGITPLSHGNYVVRSESWNQSKGAVTWGSGTSAVSGVVSSANSLVGSTPGDSVGTGGITVLSNGNYVVASPEWSYSYGSSGSGSLGAVTWGSGTSGVSGVVSSANSLVGGSSGDRVGYSAVYLSGIQTLSNGNYLVLSSDWGSGGSYGSALGAVTLSLIHI